VAKDSNLGLAFLKIRKLDDRELKPLDFSQSTTVGVGDDIRTLGRMPRGFDCAPMVVRAYVKAAVERPREMWALNLDGGDLLGMPAFNKAGTLVGFLSLQKGAEGAETESGGMMGMLGAAQNLGAFLIPAQALKPLVAAAIKAAKELQARAAEEAAEEEEDQEEGDEEEDEGSLDGEEE
jgi:S1-C subfamily serine protease